MLLSCISQCIDMFKPIFLERQRLTKGKISGVNCGGKTAKCQKYCMTGSSLNQGYNVKPLPPVYNRAEERIHIILRIFMHSTCSWPHAVQGDEWQQRRTAKSLKKRQFLLTIYGRCSIHTTSERTVVYVVSPYSKKINVPFRAQQWFLLLLRLILYYFG